MIEVEGISKSFGDTAAVSDVGFTAADGEVTYLLGPNGAGKSTVMRMIAGLTSPDSGAIVINGQARTEIREPIREIGFSLGAHAVNPGLTGSQHLRWQAKLAGLPEEDSDRLLNLVGLSKAGSRKAGGYSYGMLQRLGIASALLGNPKTLVLDEPANGLDVEGILWLRQVFVRIAEQGRCLLVASHNLPEVQVTGSRAVVMGAGRVVADATIHELVSQGTGPRPLEDVYIRLTRGSAQFSTQRSAS